MRVYIHCPECEERIDVAAASAFTNKVYHCGKHMKICPKLTTGAIVPAVAPSRVYVPKGKVHEPCNERIQRLEDQMAEANTQMAETNARVATLETKSQTYDAALIAVFPALALPLENGRAQQQLITAVESRNGASTSDALVQHDRLQSECATFKRKYEVSERDFAALVAQNKRLKNGDELRTQKKITAMHASREKAYDRCLFSLDDALRKHLLPEIGDDITRAHMRRMVADIVKKMKTEHIDIARQHNFE